MFNVESMTNNNKFCLYNVESMTSSWGRVEAGGGGDNWGRGACDGRECGLWLCVDGGL
jgi:hypothetical protein